MLSTLKLQLSGLCKNKTPVPTEKCLTRAFGNVYSGQGGRPVEAAESYGYDKWQIMNPTNDVL
jgi:hypothetical protein